MQAVSRSVERSHSVEQLLQCSTCARVVICEQPPRDVGEAFLHNAVLRVHPQRNALDDAERAQDQRKVGRDLQESTRSVQTVRQLVRRAASAQNEMGSAWRSTSGPRRRFAHNVGQALHDWRLKSAHTTRTSIMHKTYFQ